MTTTDLDILDRSIEKANLWINDIARELGTDDRHEAYRVLRAFLHALRDRLSVDEAADLSAQLPLLIRGVFYENWRPCTTPVRYRHPDEFLERVGHEALLHGETETSYAVTAAAAVLRRHVSGGEIDDILASLPAGLKPLIG
jgi:uncharacterized protein (DUF2267 family)